MVVSNRTKYESIDVSTMLKLALLAVSGKCADRMLSSPTKIPQFKQYDSHYCGMIFTANHHMFSLELPAEKSMARVLPLTAKNDY